MSNMSLHKENTLIKEGLSDKYSPINTEILLKPFFDNGWIIKRHIKPYNGIGKEKITLTHTDYFYSNGDHLTVECLNSNDGTGALILMGGYGRVVCSNGLIVGDIEGGRFVHRGKSIYERIEEQYDNIILHLDKIKADVKKLQETTFSDEQFEKVAKSVLRRVFERDTKKYKSEVIFDDTKKLYNVERLMKVRREADKAVDAFTRLNVLQENAIRYGNFHATVRTLNKETKQTKVEYKSKSRSENRIHSVQLNKLISEEFLKEVA